MARKRQADIDEGKYLRMLKEGRGQGAGATYRPWRRIDEGKSLGRCHRTASRLTGYRIHHLRSNLEYFAYLAFWWDETVEDIREHYPLLPLARTLSVARQLGIEHPWNSRTRFWIPQTIDFFVVTAYGAKGAAVMENAEWERPRTRQVFSLAKAYLAEEGIPIEPILATQLRTPRSQNLLWIYDARPSRLDKPILECGHPMVADILRAASCSAGVPSHELAQSLDRTWRATPGTALSVIRRMLAERILETNVDVGDVSRGCALFLRET